MPETLPPASAVPAFVTVTPHPEQAVPAARQVSDR
jgi:hypothetical protein